MLNGKSVLIPQGESIVQRDAQQSVYYQSLINNTKVFTDALTTNNQDCLDRLPYIMCQGSYAYCGASSVFQAADRCYCKKTMSSCGLTELHAGLFNCSIFPDCAADTKTSYGIHNSLPTSIMLMLMLAVILALQ